MMSSSRYDIAVIGKGIAACSALLTLSTGQFGVVVIAPDEIPDFKIGETLSAPANIELRKLGVYDEFIKEKNLRAFSSFSSWGHGQLDEKYIWEGRKEAGWYIDRVRFEEFLWSKARTHVDFVADRLHSTKFDDDIWNIETRDGRSIQSNYILDCSGRAAVVGRKYVQRRRLDKLVGIYSVLDQYSHDVQPTIASLVESSIDGWFYSVVTPANKLVVAYFTDNDLIPHNITAEVAVWKQFVAGSNYTARRIESAGFEFKSLPKTVDAATIISTEHKIKTLLLAGDAAASFDPLSSHGMTTALWSGRMAAEACIDLVHAAGLKYKTYQSTLRQGFAKYLIDKQTMYSIEKRFIESPFWQRRLMNS